MDLGVKFNLLRVLSQAGCEVTVFPCDTPADDILAFNPDGIVLSPLRVFSYDAFVNSMAPSGSK